MVTEVLYSVIIGLGIADRFVQTFREIFSVVYA